MDTIEIRLEYILPNPWQPREKEDPEHIKKIALSIASDGLMQAPVVRLVDADGRGREINEVFAKLEPSETVAVIWDRVFNVLGCRVQLAFGHSRLAAYKWLEEVKASSNLVGDWSRIPVIVRELSDEEMARMAVSENLARKDLSPIEEARAMARFRDEFGKTSAEIGELFHLAESSVRNKMRLLGLPEDIRAALSEGRVSEGAARELLRLFDLPEEMQELAARFQDANEWHNRSIVARALDGMTADALRGMINRLIERGGKNLHAAEWKWDEAFDPALSKEIRCETCKACTLKLTLEGKTYCPQPHCYQMKRELWIKRRLAAASLACGIAAPEDFHTVGKIEVAAEVRASGCANLRVVYDPWKSEYTWKKKPDDYVPGFDDVRVMCGNRNSICTCMNGLAARKAAEARKIEPQGTQRKEIEHDEAQEIGVPEYQERIEEERKPDASPSAEDLREAAREERRRQRLAVEEIKGLREEFARRLRDAALLSMNRFAYYQLTHPHEGTFKVEHRPQQIGPVEESVYETAYEIAERVSAYYSNPDAELSRKELNQVLKAMEIREIAAPEPEEPEYVPVDEPVRLGWRGPDGTEDVDRELPAGKSLMEVFAALDEAYGHDAEGDDGEAG